MFYCRSNWIKEGFPLFWKLKNFPKIHEKPFLKRFSMLFSGKWTFKMYPISIVLNNWTYILHPGTNRYCSPSLVHCSLGTCTGRESVWIYFAKLMFDLWLWCLVMTEVVCSVMEKVWICFPGEQILQVKSWFLFTVLENSRFFFLLFIFIHHHLARWW